MKIRATLLMLLLAFSTYSYSQTIIYVDSANVAGTHNGTSWATAYNNLATAIAAASSGTQIWVAKGTYQPAASASFTPASDNIDIYGGFTNTATLLSQRNYPTNLTVLKGNNSSVLSYSSSITSATTLDGFTITNGTGSGTTGAASGGGISMVSASPTLNNITITGNGAANGAGINMGGSSAPTLTNITLSGNKASTAGGGIYESSTGTPVLTTVTFLSDTVSGTGHPDAANTTVGGGGMYVLGNAQLNSVIFQNNKAYNSQGAGLMQSKIAGTITINGAIFYGNAAGTGGGIYSDQATTLTINNAVFAYDSSSYSPGTYAAYGAGGIAENTTSYAITNSTFYNNYTVSGGNASLRVVNGAATNSVVNSIFYNTGETSGTALIGDNNGTAPKVSYSYLPTTTGSGTTFTSVSNNVGSTTDPFTNATDPITLANMQGTDGIWMTIDDGISAKSTSAAHNAGNNTAVSSILTDITGAVRVQGGTVDMGAYEFNDSHLPVTLISFTGTLQNGTATLSWQTAEEDGFSHFELEKSIDGQTYSTAGSIPAKGNNSSYFFSTQQMENKAFYRLKIVDINGNFTYSNIVPLSQQTSDWQFYPNPAKDYIHINTTIAGTANIYDASGRLVKTQKAQVGLNVIDVSSFTRGLYFCEMNGERGAFLKQ